jgi:pSer/pThr/pTyr-binding forkhead associated (FHA) protein
MSARLIGRTGTVRGLDHTLTELVTVGSGRDSQVRIASRTVSRQHAQIVKSGSEYYVEDLGSRNGTFLNGQRVKRFAVRHLDVLSIGPEADLIFLEGEAATPRAGRRQALEASVVWVDGPLAGRVEIVTPDRGLLLGRRPEMETLGAISRRHAVLSIRDDHVTIEDLGSANGTWVGGAAIDAVKRLADGDELSLANLIRLRVSIVSMAVGAPATSIDGGAEEPVTVAVDRPSSRGGPTLERPLPQSPPATQKATSAVVPSPPPPPQDIEAPLLVSNEATQVARREPAIVPAFGQIQGAPAEVMEAGAGDATQVAPREAMVMPSFEPTPVPGQGPVTYAEARDLGAGVPVNVIEQAREARDQASSTETALVAGGSSAGSPDAAPPRAVAAAGTGRITGLRLQGARDLQLNCGTFLVGRLPESDIHVDARDVGRRHAVLRVNPDQVTIEDLATANGTFVNDQAVIGLADLPDGSRLRFATVVFAVTYFRTEGSAT